MAYSSTSGSSTQTYTSAVQATGVTQAGLNAIYAALGVDVANVIVTSGSQTFEVTSAGTAYLLSETSDQQAAIAAGYSPTTSTYNNVGAQAITITDNTNSPTYIQGTSGVNFAEYLGTGPTTGATTIDAGFSTNFIGDASHSTGNVVMKSSNVAGSKTELLGSQGSDTIYGATDTTAAGMSTTTLIKAGSGPTIVYAGTGAATVFGGGATTIYGGSHAGQALEDFTAGSADSIYAGTGGTQTLSVAHGSNLLDDSNGIGTDSLFGGDGNDTLIGSTAGTQDFLGNGLFSIVSKGADTISVSGSNTGIDTISGPTTDGVFDTVHFASSTESADQLNASVSAAATDADGGKTITFSTTGGASSTQTVHLLNATHITFA